MKFAIKFHSLKKIQACIRLRSICLLLVKTQTHESIIQAIDCGQKAFGENYTQEAVEKIQALEGYDLEWHFIGPIQSNKTKTIAAHFDWVHSIDRSKVAHRLSEQRPSHLAPLKILLQVNLDSETSKAGVVLSELEILAKEVSTLGNLEFSGLMAIPAPGKDIEAQRASFHLLAQARDNLQKQGFTGCQHLSMGMSSDKEAAIAEGSTSAYRH